MKRKMDGMAKNMICMALLFLHILVVNAKHPLAPALYVFGDSLSDSGNNNFLRTAARVNYAPYGIDFPSGSTGRYSNGRTFADFIAQLLGLPFPPAYLGLSECEKNNIKTGVNYACGGAGILPETGTELGDNLSLDEQINYFQSTVTADLPKIFKTLSEILRHLSKSIFFVSIGLNDIADNFLVPAESQLYTPKELTDILIESLERCLTRLYNLGARKFVVLNIMRFGCFPGIVNAANPRPTTPCVEDLNNLAFQFNTVLPNMTTTLECSLVGSTFILGDFYSMNLTSTETGFAAAQTPCCEVTSLGVCVPDSTPCSNRNEYVFWDAFHPTEEAVSGIATDCFSGSVSCVPIGVQQLAQIE